MSARPEPETPEIAVAGQDGYLLCPSGRSLYCVSHAAAGGAVRGRLVLFQACSEERKASHRTLVRLASALAAAGITTHRLDLPGCGESTGPLDRLRLADWLADAGFASMTLLGNGTQGAGAPATAWIGGLRLGAAVAGLCELPGWVGAPPRWLAIAPILSGAAWLRQLRTRRSIRNEITGTAEQAGGGNPTGGEDFDGFVLNAGMLADVEALDLTTQIKRSSGGVVIQAGAAKTITREFAALRGGLGGAAPEILVVRQEPFWERGEGGNDQPLIAAVVKAVAGTTS